MILDFVFTITKTCMGTEKKQNVYMVYLHIGTQWRTVGFWSQGQEVDSAPLFLIFSRKFSKLKGPRLILLQSSTLHLACLYTFMSLTLTSFWTWYAKWLVQVFKHQVDFRAPIKWRPGHVPHLPLLRYATAGTYCVPFWNMYQPETFFRLACWARCWAVLFWKMCISETCLDSHRTNFVIQRADNNISF